MSQDQQNHLVTIKIPLKRFQEKWEETASRQIHRSSILQEYYQQVLKILSTSNQNYLRNKFSHQGYLILNQYPLGSVSASGKFNDPDAGKIVYIRKSKNQRAYSRKWVYPRDPKTPDQLTQRELFSRVNSQWKTSPLQ